MIYAEAVDANTRGLLCQPGGREIFGHTAEEWTNTPNFWFDRIHPADLERVRDANRDANLTRRPYSAEYRFLRADGTYVWAQDQATIVEDEDARPFWQGIILDVTQRKQTEDALLDAERRYREIVERTPAVTYQEMPTDGEWGATVVFVSPQVEAMLGYTPEQWSSDPGFWVSVTHPDDLERIHAESSEVVESGKLWRADYRMIHRDGRVVWIHDEAILVTDDDGTARYWQGFMLDVTEQRETAERLGGNGGQVPGHRRTGPCGDLHAGDRRGRPRAVGHGVHQRAQRDLDRVHPRGDLRRSRPLARPASPGRSRPCPCGRRAGERYR